MAEVPNWVVGHGGITAFLYLAQFFLSNVATPATSGNVFEAIGRFFTFSSIPGVPEWVPFVMFALFTLPWVLLLTSFAFQAFNSEIGTGLAIIILGVSALFAFAGFS